jgi:hypothetical protein
MGPNLFLPQLYHATVKEDGPGVAPVALAYGSALLNLAVASEPPADVENLFNRAQESLGLAERIYHRYMLLDATFFAPRAALATEKLRELQNALGVPEVRLYCC